MLRDALRRSSHFMRYTVARTTFNIMKWFWPAAVAIFGATYAANIAPLPAKQFFSQFYDSTFGSLFHPILPLVLTLTVLIILLVITFVSWQFARRAPKGETAPTFGGTQWSHDNSAPTAQVQGSST